MGLFSQLLLFMYIFLLCIGYKERRNDDIIYFCGALYAMEQRIWSYLFGWVFMFFCPKACFEMIQSIRILIANREN